MAAAETSMRKVWKTPAAGLTPRSTAASVLLLRVTSHQFPFGRSVGAYSMWHVCGAAAATLLVQPMRTTKSSAAVASMGSMAATVKSMGRSPKR